MSDVWELVIPFKTETAALLAKRECDVGGIYGATVRKVNPDAVPVADPE